MVVPGLELRDESVEHLSASVSVREQGGAAGGGVAQAHSRASAQMRGAGATAAPPRGGADQPPAEAGVPTNLWFQC